jgi:hypothetical protein
MTPKVDFLGKSNFVTPQKSPVEQPVYNSHDKKEINCANPTRKDRRAHGEAEPKLLDQPPPPKLQSPTPNSDAMTSTMAIN